MYYVYVYNVHVARHMHSRNSGVTISHTPAYIKWRMASYGGGESLPSDYPALRDVRRELVNRITDSEADENVLIAKAKDKGLVQSIQASATVAPGRQSKREKVGQLVNQAIQAIKSDETKLGVFLQLLEECSLGNIAAYLSEKREEHARARQRRTRQSTGRGNDLPKLETAGADDSAFAEDAVPQSNGTTHHQLTATGGAGEGASFKPITSGVVYVEQNHGSNLTVESEDPLPSVEDTQPHTEEGLWLLVSASGSVPVLPETKRLEQANRDLQAQLAEKESEEKRLTEELEEVHMEKEKIERELEEKEKQLEEKELQIKTIKAKMESLQQELKAEKKNNMTEKEKHEKEIEEYKRQLKEEEDMFLKEKLQLIEEKHELELKVQKMFTREETMKRQISEEQLKVAELHADASERNHKQELDEWKRKHEEEKKRHEKEKKKHEQESRKNRNDIAEMQDKIRRLSSVRDSEPDTS